MDSIGKRSSRGGLLTALLLVAAVAAFGSLAGSARAGDVDNETCLACHDDVGENFQFTAHGTYFESRPALTEFGCESCHGSGVDHIDDPTPENILNPANAGQFGSTVLCLQCHKDTQFDEWDFSHHNSADLNCSSCHVVHASHAQSLKKPTPELCYDCHSNVRAAA